MAVPSMILVFVFLPSLAAQPHSPLIVNIDGKAALVKEKTLVRAEGSGEQTRITAILDDGTPKSTHDDGTPKSTHDKVGHDTNAKVARKQHQHQTLETLLEKEDTTSASFVAETREVKSAVPKDTRSDDKKKWSWDGNEDEDDDGPALDELEELTVGNSLRAKHDPPPEDCTWNEWEKLGECGSEQCSCGCMGDQHYIRKKNGEKWGGKKCSGERSKTEVCDLPTCPPTPAPTPPNTTTPEVTAITVTTTPAFATRTGSINVFSLLGLFTAVLYNIH